MNILNIAAHPDDDLLGQGGTIARHALAGDRVTTLIVCEGATVRYGQNAAAEIESHARDANRILGVPDVRFLGLPEQGLDGLRLLDVARLIEQVMSEVRPEVVYTHSAADLNRDHRVLLEAVLVAARPYAAPTIREIWTCDTASSSEWGGPPLLAPFQPQMYVDISGTLDLKIRALECYAREVRPWPHPRSSRAIRARAEYWGSHAGFVAAEPFQLVRARRA